ncbi:hypothetical protein BC835DRAFT_377962 [Cytidiella melzeri]|nr:hypothetical protein BC835DRAFT_377962 [Cytidiella melzeri]
MGMLSVARSFCFAVLSALKGYAFLDGHHLLITCVVLALTLTLVLAATNMFNFITGLIIVVSKMSFGYENCIITFAVSKKVGLALSLATRSASVILADIIVILGTWSRTYQPYRTARKHIFKALLMTLLFRDGTLYLVTRLVGHERDHCASKQCALLGDVRLCDPVPWNEPRLLAP